MDLSVVFLSYNTKDFTEGALRTVIDATEGLEVEIFVADNDSRDGSPDMVAEKFPQVRLILNGANLGFSAGTNVALREATGRYVMLLNTDTLVRKDTLRTLVDFMDAHPEAGAAGCKILNPDGSLQLDSRRGFPSPLAAFSKMSGLSRLFPRHPRLGHYNMTYLDPEEISEVEVLSGSCMVVRKEVMDQVGMMDEDYFMYGDDIDWCYRIHSAGWKIYYVPTTEIIHFRGESGRAEPLRILYLKSKAMSIFVNKHMRHRFRFFPIWLLQVAIAFYGLLKFGLRLARHLFLPCVDGALMLIGLKLALALRYHDRLHQFIHAIEQTANRIGLEAQPTNWLTPPPYTETQWLMVYAAPTAIWLLTFYLFGLYGRRKYSALWTSVGVALGFASVVTTVFFFKAYNFSRLAAGAAWFFNTLLLAGWRLTARRVLHSRRGRRRTLLVGTDAAAERFVGVLEKLEKPPYELIGLVGEGPEQRGRFVADRPVIGLVDELQRLVRRYEVEQLIFTSATVSLSLDQLEGRWGRRNLRICMLPGTFADVDEEQFPASAGELPLIEIAPEK